MYKIYFNNGETINVSSDHFDFFENIIVFYDGDVKVACIPNNLIVIKIK